MKLGVVIQGPLISFGQGPNNSIEGFDTLETILKNIEQLSNHGFCYIVSTWLPSSKQEQEIINSLQYSNVSLIQNLSPQLFDPDHRYKQHFGVLEGAKVLLEKCSDITHFLKIRTDMLMPKSFWDWVHTVILKDEKYFYVSELMNRPFYQGDFVYLAEKQIFLDFLTTVVGYKNHVIHPSIAFDMGIKHCEAHNFGVIYRRKYLGQLRFLIDFIFRTDAVRRCWNKFIMNHIGVMPESIWTEIEWRGRRIGSILDGKWFKFDNSEISQGTKVFENLRTIFREYKIYGAKCRRGQMK